jgi:hypothetical protein
LIGLPVVALFLLGAAATQRVRREEPKEVKLQAERLGENGKRCLSEKDVEQVRGPVPADARGVVRMTLTAGEPLNIDLFEQAFTQRATKYCCDGVSLLQATADPSTGGVLSAVATGWTREPPAPLKRAEPPVDAGPSDPFEF